MTLYDPQLASVNPLHISALLVGRGQTILTTITGQIITKRQYRLH